MTTPTQINEGLALAADPLGWSHGRPVVPGDGGWRDWDPINNDADFGTLLKFVESLECDSFVLFYSTDGWDCSITNGVYHVLTCNHETHRLAVATAIYRLEVQDAE